MKVNKCPGRSGSFVDQDHHGNCLCKETHSLSMIGNQSGHYINDDAAGVQLGFTAAILSL